ncbi:hypothetical protein HZS_1919, partial [Henneguya salminicola]
VKKFRKNQIVNATAQFENQVLNFTKTQRIAHNICSLKFQRAKFTPCKILSLFIFQERSISYASFK